MKRWISGMIAVACLLTMSGCGNSSEPTENKEVTLVLDYVPNTNHTGIYVAQDLGYFEDEGLTVNIIEPDDKIYNSSRVVNKFQFAFNA